MIKLKCNHCGNDFSAKRKSAKYCSNTCKTLASRAKLALEQKIREEEAIKLEAIEKESIKKLEKDKRLEILRAQKALKAAQDKEEEERLALIRQEEKEKENARLAEIEEEKKMAEKAMLEKTAKEKEDAKKADQAHRERIAKRKEEDRKKSEILWLAKWAAIFAGANLLLNKIAETKSSTKNS